MPTALIRNFVPHHCARALVCGRGSIHHQPLASRHLVKSAGCWIVRLGRNGRRCIAGGFANCPELTLLEFTDADAAPAFGGADQRRIHQLQDGALARGMRDDPRLRGGRFLVRRRSSPNRRSKRLSCTDRPAVAEREAQMRAMQASIILEAGHRAWQIAPVGRPEDVA
jgi:hypothetical protein